jgi:SagB-type dehydrogenase family enzyme
MSRSFLALLLVPAGLFAQDLKPVALPAPQTSGGKPLMQALKERKSTRELSTEKLSPQVLSNLLWAGWGINREDGRRTAPSASNRQEIEIYAVMADGVYVYDAKGNALKPVVTGDLRKATGTPAYVGEAPLNLVYVADFSKMGNGDENAKTATANANTGLIAQNVYLFCASEGLGTVVRGSVPRAELSKALNLRPDQRITLAQTVGYIKK